MSASTRVFVRRLTQLSVFDPSGDEVGRVRDVVLGLGALRRGGRGRAIGLVVEVSGRRRVFMPLTRITGIEGGQLISTGVVNLRQFEQRTGESLAVGEVLDRMVRLRQPDPAREPGHDGDTAAARVGVDARVEDLAIEQQKNRDWLVSKVSCRVGAAPARRRLLGGRPRGELLTVDVTEVEGLQDPEVIQAADSFVDAYDDLNPADLARAVHDLAPKRRTEVAAALDDETLADVLEELPGEDRIGILTGLATDRAADVLETMEPDDATDLLADLPKDVAERYLRAMEPDEAAQVRRLMTYAQDTAGGLMTPEPIILEPGDSIAEALALVRREQISPALATVVFVVRPPVETPTGRYLGLVHIQQLLREPPHQPVGDVLDRDVDPLGPDTPLSEITRRMATYNLVGMPVADENGSLLGAVTVDDVLDHLLPDDWRHRSEGTAAHA